MAVREAPPSPCDTNKETEQAHAKNPSRRQEDFPTNDAGVRCDTGSRRARCGLETTRCRNRAGAAQSLAIRSPTLRARTTMGICPMEAFGSPIRGCRTAVESDRDGCSGERRSGSDVLWVNDAARRASSCVPSPHAEEGLAPFESSSVARRSLVVHAKQQHPLAVVTYPHRRLTGYRNVKFALRALFAAELAALW